jgi:hypothetical protein
MPRRFLIVGVIALLFALQAFIRFHSSLIHDTAWYVYVAQGLLEGKKLYVDFVEVNPPLGMWLIVPPVWFANLAGLDSTACLFGYLLLLTAAALCGAWRLVQGEPSARKLFLIAAATILLFTPGNNFGQREHFMVLLFLPWVMLRVNAEAKASLLERVIIGALAGLAIALKPHAIFAPVLVEAVLYIQRRNWRSLFTPENFVAVAAVSIYGASIILFTPEFFGGIIGMGRTAYLPYYGYPLPIVLMDAKWAVIFMALAGFGCLTRRYKCSGPRRLAFSFPTFYK